MLYWIQILPPIGGATSMDFFATQIACLIAAFGKHKNNYCLLKCVIESASRIHDYSFLWVQKITVM